MAEALLAAAVEVTICKVVAMASDQISLAWGFKDELRKLQTSLSMVNAFLQDADQKQSAVPSVKLWLQQLRNFSEEADDLVDELGYEFLRWKVEIGSQMHRKFSNFFSFKNPVAFRVKVANKIRHLVMSIRDINSEATELGLQQRLMHVHHVCDSMEETHSFLGDSKVVGREADLSKVVDMLIRSSDSEQPLCAVSIVGMPGIGKTTLAKLVLDDEQVKSQFDVRIWVCVWANFDVKRILREMLESQIDGNVLSFESKETILQNLHQKLLGKRYLLVLDDVWNEDAHKWEDLRECLLGINKRKENAILATTRSENVASTMESLPKCIHHPTKLNDAECWSIIKERAIGSFDVLPAIESIGRDIAKKCKGVPLVAKVIGGTMRKKRDEEAWTSILQSNLWDSLESNEGIVRVLKLSFDRLDSPSLKKCFAYCSIFPKGSLLRKEQLIQLWTAAGLLHPCVGSQKALDMGNSYFNALLSNSLFQDAETDLYGNIVACKMHDLVHNLAKSLSEAKAFISDINPVGDISSIRHLNIAGKARKLAQKLQDVDARKLSTLFSRVDIMRCMSKGVKRLRVLSFAEADINDIPASVGKLKHLRYFDISGTKIQKLPISITKLYHLQTFKFMDCGHLKRLPEQMSNLVSLENIIFNEERLMPINIGNLTHLQTLPLFVVGSKRGYKIEELGSLSQLRGELKICKLELVRDMEEAATAKLQEKTQIHELELEWSEGREDSEHDEDILTGLQPHKHLKGLTICKYKGQHFPLWVMTGVHNSQPLLYNLVKLRLISCNRCTKLPSLGHLPNLEFLEVSKLNKVKFVDGDFYADGFFPMLKMIEISHMGSLEEWVEAAVTNSVFPLLKELVVRDCPRLKHIPIHKTLPSLEKLQIESCTALRSIGDGVSASTCLKGLFIKGCDTLRLLPDVHGLSSLTELWILDCKEIRCVPVGLQHCATLNCLWLRKCPNMTSGLECLGELTALVHLAIVECDKLSSVIPEESLGHLIHLKGLLIGGEMEEFPPFFKSIYHLRDSLEMLRLFGGGKIMSFPHQLQHLVALKELLIFKFPALEALPEWLEKLSSLEELKVVGCQNLRVLPSAKVMQQLKKLLIYGSWSEVEGFPPYFNSIQDLSVSLQALSLGASRTWKSLPDQLGKLSSLKELLIDEFEEIECLPEWLGELRCLQKLRIQVCEKLIYLPSQQAMQGLSKLKYLSIYCCPKLQHRCARGSGPEWCKISHIPLIAFDGDTVQDLDMSSQASPNLRFQHSFTGRIQ